MILLALACVMQNPAPALHNTYLASTRGCSFTGAAVNCGNINKEVIVHGFAVFVKDVLLA
jgi:hypothetical protein